MSIYVGGTKIDDVKVYTGTYPNHTATSSLIVGGTEITTAYVDGVQVYGDTNSWTPLFSFGLAPDSSNLENAVSTLQSSYSYAFIPGSYYYDVGPGSDSRWRYSLRYGYRMVTSDGTFTADNNLHYLWEGRTVTGADTSHNGGTSCTLQKLNFI